MQPQRSASATAVLLQAFTEAILLWIFEALTAHLSATQWVGPNPNLLASFVLVSSFLCCHSMELLAISWVSPGLQFSPFPWSKDNHTLF